MARVLITAGPTREYLDPVRFLSNASTGKMARAICQALLDLGHEVVVVSGPVSVRYPESAMVQHVVSTNQMLHACLERINECDGVIAVAAPCDFRPSQFSNQKIKKQQDVPTLSIQLEKTPDILAALTQLKPSAWYVGFALETHDGIANAVEKRRNKKCDVIVLNEVAAIGASQTKLRVIDATDQVAIEISGTKDQAAKGLVAHIHQALILKR